MQKRLIDAAPRHHVAAEKNPHRRRSFREADRDMVVRACQDGQTARSALGVAAITSSISLAGTRAASS